MRAAFGDDMVHLALDLNPDPELSHSGQSLVLASTNGNVVVGIYGGRPVYFQGTVFQLVDDLASNEVLDVMSTMGDPEAKVEGRAQVIEIPKKGPGRQAA